MKNKSIFYIFICLLFILLSINFNIAAEEISLNRAVKLLKTSSSQLDNVLRDIESAEIDLKLAEKGLAAEVTLQTSYTRLDEAPQSPTEYVLSPTGKINFQGSEVNKYRFIPVTFEKLSQDNYRASLTINKPLYLGGQVKNAVKLSEKAVQLSKLNYEKTLNDRINSIIQAYFNVLIKDSLLSVQKNSLKLVQEHLDNVIKNYEAGIAIKSDVNEVEIELNKSKQSLYQSENELKIAKKRLAELLNLSNLDFSLIEPKLPELKEELNFHLQRAYNNSFELQSLLLKQKMNDINKEMEDKLFKPSFFLNGNYTIQGDKLDLDQGDFNITLSGSVTLYDGNKSKLNIRKINLEEASLKNNQKQLKNNIETEIMAALYKIDENKKNLKIAEKNKIHALENYNQAVNSFNNGVVSSLDVLRAETNLNQIKISKNQTYYQYMMSVYKLLYQTGTLNNYFEEVIQSENR